MTNEPRYRALAAVEASIARRIRPGTPPSSALEGRPLPRYGRGHEHREGVARHRRRRVRARALREEGGAVARRLATPFRFAIASPPKSGFLPCLIHGHRIPIRRMDQRHAPISQNKKFFRAPGARYPAIISRTRAASASASNGFTISPIPGARNPCASAAFSA